MIGISLFNLQQFCILIKYDNCHLRKFRGQLNATVEEKPKKVEHYFPEFSTAHAENCSGNTYLIK
jgi:hypothetical protein